MKVKVRAIPAPGFDHRWRCGKRWPKESVTVEVVESPEKWDPKEHAVPRQISPAEYVELQADDRIAVMPLDGSIADAEETVLLKVRLAEVETERDKLRSDLAAAIEAAEAGRPTIECIQPKRKPQPGPKPRRR